MNQMSSNVGTHDAPARSARRRGYEHRHGHAARHPGRAHRRRLWNQPRPRHGFRKHCGHGHDQRTAPGKGMGYAGNDQTWPSTSRPTQTQCQAFPQDAYMEGPAMAMDQMVDKPENYGLRPGWSGYMMGMMTFLRVLPPDKYEEVVARMKQAQRPNDPYASLLQRHFLTTGRRRCTRDSRPYCGCAPRHFSPQNGQQPRCRCAGNADGKRPCTSAPAAAGCRLAPAAQAGRLSGSGR